MKKKKYLSSAILYGVIALICLIGIKQLYIFFFIFLALCGLNVFFAYKHRDDKPHPIIQELHNRKKKKKEEKKEIKNNRKQLKVDYKNRLEQIEEDFDFDYGDEDDEEANTEENDD